MVAYLCLVTYLLHDCSSNNPLENWYHPGERSNLICLQSHQFNSTNSCALWLQCAVFKMHCNYLLSYSNSTLNTYDLYLQEGERCRQKQYLQVHLQVIHRVHSSKPWNSPCGSTVGASTPEGQQRLLSHGQFRIDNKCWHFQQSQDSKKYIF